MESNMKSMSQPSKRLILLFIAVCTCRLLYPEQADESNRIPWKEGQTVSYRFIFDGQDIGTDTFSIKNIKKDGQRLIYTCHTELKLQGRSTSGSWSMDQHGKPLEYRISGKAGATSYSIDCRFSGGTVKVEASQSGNPFSRSLDINEDTRLLDNNNLSLFAFLLASVNREAGQTASYSVFHPTSLRIFSIDINVRKRETINLAEREIFAWRFEISMAGTPLTMWLDDGGRLLRDEESGGRMVVELIENTSESKNY